MSIIWPLYFICNEGFVLIHRLEEILFVSLIYLMIMKLKYKKTSVSYIKNFSHIYIVQTFLNLVCILSCCVTRKAGF